MTQINWHVKKLLINRIGHKTYKKLCPKVKYIFLGDELKKFRQELILKYGSASAYERHWLAQQGFRKIEYVNMLARQRGFKNQKEYLDDRYQQKGFIGLYDYRKFKRLARKYPNLPIEEIREIQLKKELGIKC